MDKIEQKAILMLALTHKNICVNIGTYTDFLRPEWNAYIQPVTDLKTIKSGLYGHLMECKVWVKKFMAPDSVSFSDLEITDPSDSEKWSPPQLIKDTEEYIRVSNIRAFL